MYTINDLVKSGMEFFTGKTVLKATMDEAVANLIAQRDAESALSKKLNEDLAAAITARDAAVTAAADAAKALEAARAEVTTLTARVAALESEKKTVAVQAAEIAAASGHPGPVVLKPDPAGAGAQGSPSDLLAARAAIKDPAKLAEFDAKHRDRLFAETQARLRAERR